MPNADLIDNPDAATLAAALGACARDLFPICRSITGDGVRRTLARLSQEVPLAIHEVPSGTAALDWTVPPEWNIRDAWIKDAKGRRLVDFRDCNLHVVGYSVPVHRRLRLGELRPHLHTLPDQPDRVPYRTSYYREQWGFCLSQNVLDAMPDAEYEVCIDATLGPGALTYGEAFLPGTSEAEVLFACHVCHPSLANDNVSGMAVAAHLARVLAARPRRLSYRFLFAPATIGAITWLSRNAAAVGRIRHGLVLTSLGRPQAFTYKKSRRGDATIDRVAAGVVGRRPAHRVIDFAPHGYDERQFGSPGFDLPVGRLSRAPDEGFPGYHTSADDLAALDPAAMAESLLACLEIVAALEGDRAYLNLCPMGEPQLGRRGLYRAVGGLAAAAQGERAMLWMLNLSDGRHTLQDIARRSGLGADDLAQAARVLVEHGLLAEMP